MVTKILQRPTLVLNRNWQPVHVATVARPPKNHPAGGARTRFDSWTGYLCLANVREAR